MSILFFKSAYGEILDIELHITDCYSSINENVHVKGSSLHFIYTENGAKDIQGMQQDVHPRITPEEWISYTNGKTRP
jgi:hypothetical protein